MTRNNRNTNNENNWFPFALLFFGIFSGLGFLVPIAIIWIVFASISKNGMNTNKSYTRKYNSASSSRGTYRNSRRAKYTASQLSEVNIKLRKYFKNNTSLPVMNDINLRLKGSTYASLSSLNVFKGDDCICSLNEFGNTYGDMYDQIIKLLIKFSKQPDTENIFDAQATETPVQAKEEKKEEPKKQEEKKLKNSKEFIDEINQLNVEIPDKEITEGLYESCALLKQIGDIETKFPANSPKLVKLYQYYLPILLSNLNQYKDLQAAQANTNFADVQMKLRKNIILINEAMKTITASLCDQDFINLSADISTLEAVLKKDGLAGEGRLSQVKTAGGNDDK